MRQVNDTQYQQFTPAERVQLTLAAIGRGDEAEANRLWQTCPNYHYEETDIEYTSRISALIMLGSIFFEKCVYHYNHIQKANTCILATEHELGYENEKNLVEFSKITQRLLELSAQARNLHISRLKGLYEGFKQFCSDVGIRSENILNTLTIKGCCFEIDLLLSSEITIDTEYTQLIKEFFLENWHF